MLEQSGPLLLLAVGGAMRTLPGGSTSAGRPWGSLAQIQTLVAALEAGPVAAGHVNDLWPPPRVAALVQQLSGERYHAGHCRHWLRQPGFSGPRLRARRGQPPVVGFLQALLRQVPGKVLVIWDGAGQSPLPVGAGLRGGHGGAVGASPAARLRARPQPGGRLVGAPQRT